MQRELLHLYGPFSINSFGLMIIIGLLVFSYLLLKDPKRPSIISIENYFNILTPGIIAGLVGGRLLFVLTHWASFDHWIDIFAIWQGGFSLLGGILALIIVMPFYFKKYTITTLPFLDLISIYAPLLQSISRIGCYVAGCCFGCSATYFFTTHPTQLYSALALFLIFLFQYLVARKWHLKPGQLFCIYLLAMSAERFCNDFFRGEREMSSIITSLSVAQIMSSIIFVGAGGAYFVFNSYKKNSS